jgi:hypothetical protein
MIHDESLSEIWEIRKNIYKNCGATPKNLITYYMKIQVDSPEICFLNSTDLTYSTNDEHKVVAEPQKTYKQK